ncbi:MAG: hypothetical protein K9N11_02810 [Lentisphaeria bacterium]|nr:hypothetical protein [Candidatus Neomarinimicrobiota bacterium]MCF7841762.1 hypothetical protein [Lentisphaeria bacterium]
MVETIKAGATGLVYKNSVFLPFHFELISIWIGKEMSLLASPEHYVDFCGCDGDVGVRTSESYTNLIFREYKDLVKDFSKNRGHVILYCTEKGDDIFKKNRRHYVKMGFEEDSNQVSLELIDDPFDL